MIHDWVLLSRGMPSQSTALSVYAALTDAQSLVITSPDAQEWSHAFGAFDCLFQLPMQVACMQARSLHFEMHAFPKEGLPQSGSAGLNTCMICILHGVGHNDINWLVFQIPWGMQASAWASLTGFCLRIIMQLYFPTLIIHLRPLMWRDLAPILCGCMES